MNNALEQSARDFSQTLDAMRIVGEQPGKTGTIECPRCGGNVTFRKSATPKKPRPRRMGRRKLGRPFQRGKCETTGCLAWIT